MLVGWNRQRRMIVATALGLRKRSNYLLFGVQCDQEFPHGVQPGDMQAITITGGEAELQETMNAAAGGEALEAGEIKRGDVKRGGTSEKRCQIGKGDARSEREREKRRCRRGEGVGGRQRRRCETRRKIGKGEGGDDEAENDDDADDDDRGRGRGGRGYDDADEGTDSGVRGREDEATTTLRRATDSGGRGRGGESLASALKSGGEREARKGTTVEIPRRAKMTFYTHLYKNPIPSVRARARDLIYISYFFL
ncbi:hypothetical protein ACLOJK_035981 [Asimina triloba]